MRAASHRPKTPNSDKSDKRAQQRAGHKNISNTMIYTHVSDEQASESCCEALTTAFV